MNVGVILVQIWCNTLSNDTHDIHDILTVRVGDEEKTIKAEHVSLFFDTENEKEQRFFDTCNAISDLLEATDEWKALPDFENFYE